jgi:hypothetical protein
MSLDVTDVKPPDKARGVDVPVHKNDVASFWKIFFQLLYIANIVELHCCRVFRSIDNLSQNRQSSHLRMMVLQSLLTFAEMCRASIFEALDKPLFLKETF